MRGGTQKDGQLFFRHEPVIQRLRARVTAAVRSYLDDLPAFDPGHPLLGIPRGSVHFAGSWSVRLGGGGYNVSHTHALGWISSALYVSLPAPQEMGAPPQGWIRFGVPQPELELNLSPYLEVPPRPGRLVLFPSTLWHGTVPFSDGERLVVSFDVAVGKS